MSELIQVVPQALPDHEAWPRIAGVARELTALPDGEPRLKWLSDFACDLWDVPAAAYVPIARHFSDMNARPAKGTAAFWEHIVRQERPFVLEPSDLALLAHSLELPAVVAELHWQRILMAPVLRPDRAVGVLMLAESRPRDFGERDLAWLDALMPQVASVFDATILTAENRYKQAYSRALGDIDMMIASYDIDEIVRHGVRRIHETIEVERVLVFLVDPGTGEMKIAVAMGCDHPAEGMAEQPCARLAAKVLAERRSQMVGPGDEGCHANQGIVTPIMANNRLFGVLQVLDKRNGRAFHRNEIAFVNQVALKVALVVQNTHAYLTINQLNAELEDKVRERTGQLEQAITTLQETQSQLMQTEKLATMGTLAGGIAHEINNPLAAILANVQLLKLDVEDPEQRDSIDIIEDGARRCKHIVEGLLNYARAGSSEQRSLSVNAIMQDTLDMLGHRLKLANVKLDLALGEVAPVRGVATEVGQVFTNLIVNAVDAMTELRGTVGPSVLTVRSRQEGRHVVVEVTDDGPGMPEHVLRRIFNPFFTTKQVGKGTGLGLSVSQQIAAALGGHLEARSAPGEGATFQLSLPVADGSAA